MAVSNNLSGAPEQNKMEIVYKVGAEDVKLSPGIVKKYLVSGDADKVSTGEVVMFMQLCKYQGLNPFLREAYLVKFGDSPAQIITGKAAWEKKAQSCERYRGFTAGIIVVTPNGEVLHRDGTFKLPDEQLVGGWARVFVDGFAEPVIAEVSMDEYNTGKSIWKTKPATMIRKVAKVQAMREAFPAEFNGMYTQEEVGVDGTLPEAPIDITSEAPVVEAEVIETPEHPGESFAEILEG